MVDLEDSGWSGSLLEERRAGMDGEEVWRDKRLKSETGEYIETGMTFKNDGRQFELIPCEIGILRI